MYHIVSCKGNADFENFPDAFSWLCEYQPTYAFINNVDVFDYDFDFDDENLSVSIQNLKWAIDNQIVGLEFNPVNDETGTIQSFTNSHVTVAWPSHVKTHEQWARVKEVLDL